VDVLTAASEKGRSGLPFGAASLLGIIGLAVAGCADLTDDTLQRDVAQLRRDVNTLMVASNRGGGRGGDAEAVSQMERRSREQASESARQAASLSARLDALSSELSRLSTRLDDLSQRVESNVRQNQRVGVTPRPAPLPSVTVPPSPALSTPPPSASPSLGEIPRGSATAPSGGSSGSGSAQEVYQSAYLDFSKGRYALAIPAFRDFLRRFPDSPLADSAQYAIGESYFSLARASASSGQADKSKQELEQSVQEFRRVLLNFPRGSKVPTALYKEALALTELKQTTLAQARLQYLLDHFPQSEEAPLAKERLAALKQ
jgi:TolA-binding protein